MDLGVFKGEKKIPVSARGRAKIGSSFSLIRTVTAMGRKPSVREFHPFGPARGSWTLTTGKEFHLFPKN